MLSCYTLKVYVDKYLCTAVFTYVYTVDVCCRCRRLRGASNDDVTGSYPANVCTSLIDVHTYLYVDAYIDVAFLVHASEVRVAQPE